MEMIPIEKDTNLPYILIPYFLFEDRYSDLKIIDRFLYAILFYEYKKSINREQKDTTGYYILIPQKKLLSLLNCTQPTLINSFKRLKNKRLVDNKVINQLNNKIYLLPPDVGENLKYKKGFFSDEDIYAE